MRQVLLRLYRSRHGVVSIEFVLTSVALMFMVLFILELAQLSYISSVLDLAVSEAAKEAKNAKRSHSEYQERFQARLTTEQGQLWRFITQKDAVEINVIFSQTIQDAINGRHCTPTSNAEGHDCPLARYQLTYRYQPMFFPFTTTWANELLNREVLFVQEYER